MIASTFDLRYVGSGALPDVVKMVDNSILVDEYEQLMAHTTPWNLPYVPLGVTVEGWSPHRAKTEFLDMARVVGLLK